MSIAIIGGNERMERNYKNVCEDYGHTAKTYMKMSAASKCIGKPDLMILFTSTLSHKMLRRVMSEAKANQIPVAHCHSSSLSALKNTLNQIGA